MLRNPDMYLPLIAIFIAISGGLGISYMAERSSPGDPLYAIKVHVNDNFRQTADETILEETPLEVPSHSIYLQASASESATLGDAASVSSETTLSASTSLNADQVINVE